MNEWKEIEGQLENEYQFSDFLTALEFVNKVAAIAESMDHHPDILVHSYNKVKLRVMTHSEGKITQKDHQLADKIENI